MNNILQLLTIYTFQICGVIANWQNFKRRQTAQKEAFFVIECSSVNTCISVKNGAKYGRRFHLRARVHASFQMYGRTAAEPTMCSMRFCRRLLILASAVKQYSLNSLLNLLWPDFHYTFHIFLRHQRLNVSFPDTHSISKIVCLGFLYHSFKIC